MALLRSGDLRAASVQPTTSSVAGRWPKRCLPAERIFLFVCNKDGRKTFLGAYRGSAGAPREQHTVSERNSGRRTLTDRYHSIGAGRALLLPE